MSAFKKTKIVYLLGTLRIGGTERQVVETATRLNPAYFEPKIYCLSGTGPLKSYVTQHGIDVTVFNSFVPGVTPPELKPRFRRSKKFLALYHYLKKEQPDIIHCYLFTPSIYGGIAGKLAGNPVLLTNRRCLGQFKDSSPHYQILENVVNRFTDGVLVNSQALKQDVLRRERFVETKIHVVPNGVDTHLYHPKGPKNSQVSREKAAWGIPAEAPVVGMIANLIPYKGYQDFLLAASDVQRRHPETRFLCVGEDRGIRSQLESLVQTFAFPDRVIFTGQVPNVAEILRILDIQVSASHEEGFSNAILEGMATGKPLVATAVGGTPEVVVDQHTGLLVPPKDPARLAQAMNTLLDNPHITSQLGDNGRKYIEKYFSIEKMIDNLENLYLNFIENNRCDKNQNTRGVQ